MEPEYQYCIEHGAYPIDDYFCPGCEEVERQIDDSIERDHQNKSEGEIYGQT